MSLADQVKKYPEIPRSPHGLLLRAEAAEHLSGAVGELISALSNGAN